MSAILDLVSVILVLSIPFMFGIIVGREFPLRRKGRTSEHEVGEGVFQMVKEVSVMACFVGDDMTVRKVRSKALPDGRMFVLEVRLEGLQS